MNAFLIDNSTHDIHFDRVNMNLLCPPWVAWSDVKFTRLVDKFTGVLLNSSSKASNIKIESCQFNGVFDGIIATGKNKHNIRVHDSSFTVFDDALQLGSANYDIEFSYNMVIGPGPSHHGTGSSPFPGTKYIHHNIIDTSRPMLYGRKDPTGYLKSKYRGWRHPMCHGGHVGSGYGDGDPWKIYNNTYLFGENIGSVGPGIAPKGRSSKSKHEVYNCILIQNSDLFITRNGRVDDGKEIRDGNVYYRTVKNPKDGRFLAELQSGGSTGHFSSLAKFKSSKHYAVTKKYYTPGWEASGLEVNPQLDKNYAPQNDAAWFGGVDLSKKGWPGTQSLKGDPYRGAIAP